jgi:hypothetical protein
MDKVHISNKQKLIPLDMNDLHNLAEAALADLIRSFTGGQETVLLKDAIPTAVHVTPNIRIDVPQQWFAVLGIPEKIAASIITKPETSDYHRIFFVLSRNDQSDNRDFVQTSPTIQVVTQTTVIRKNTAARIEVTSSGSHTTPPGTPTLNPNDIGYVELASVIWDGAAFTVNHNIPAIYAFPGSASSVSTHGPTHLPGGGDEVPISQMGGDPSGSTAGLMPAGSLALAKGSIQVISISDLSKFLTRVMSGNNSPGDPKTAELRLRIGESLKQFESSGNFLLGLNFDTGPYAGDSGRPAMSNHTHPPSESPVAVLRHRIPLDSSNLGTLVDVPTIAGISRIYQTQVFWVPPGLTSPPYPMVECSWFKDGTTVVGIKANIISGNEVKLEVAGQALCYLSHAMYQYVLTKTGGSPNWTYGSYGVLYPTQGEIYVKVVGLR